MKNDTLKILRAMKGAIELQIIGKDFISLKERINDLEIVLDQIKEIEGWEE